MNMILSMRLVLAAATLAAPTTAQLPPANPFSSAFNSSFALTDAEIEAASLSPELASSVNAVLNFERSSHAYGGPRQDDFYIVPELSTSEIAHLGAGQVLKVQEVTDPSQLAITAGSSMSRILYVTENFNGTLVPASAYILWPFRPRKGAERAPTVLFAHGTSGFFADAAPSAHRVLQYDYHMTLSLVQAGYAVVAPDYAGLGVERSWDGSNIPHQYFAAPSGGYDMLHAMEAALETFEERLSGQFAVVGHSQGGGIAWSTAELLAGPESEFTAGSSDLPKVSSNDSDDGEFRHLAEGYVGTIAVAPVTKPATMLAMTIVMWAITVDSIFPDFTMNNWLTPLAIERVKLLRKHQGAATVAQQLFLNDPPEAFLKPNWRNATYHAQALSKWFDIGGRSFAGPMLVIQGTNDFFVEEGVTGSTIAQVCRQEPEAQLEYVVGEGSGHTPILNELRNTWMEWLELRFDGKDAHTGCSTKRLRGWLGEGKHSQAHNSYAQWVGLPEYSYQNLGAV